MKKDKIYQSMIIPVFKWVEYSRDTRNGVTTVVDVMNIPGDTIMYDRRHIVVDPSSMIYPDPPNPSITSNMKKIYNTMVVGDDTAKDNLVYRLISLDADYQKEY